MDSSSFYKVELSVGERFSHSESRKGWQWSGNFIFKFRFVRREIPAINHVLLTSGELNMDTKNEHGIGDRIHRRTNRGYGKTQFVGLTLSYVSKQAQG